MFPHAQRQPLMITLSFLGSTARRPCTNRSDASHVNTLESKQSQGSPLILLVTQHFSISISLYSPGFPSFIFADPSLLCSI